MHAHPDPDSYSTALRTRAVAALEAAGNEVEIIDLYGIGFDPNLSSSEHEGYDTIAADHPDPVVAAHIEAVRAAHALVFILKGWLDRTLLPGVAFTLSPGGDGSTRVTPALDNITRLVGITTYGSGRADVLLLGDAGRRTVTRTVRLVCARRCRTTWLGLHRLDTASVEERVRFLDRVDTKLRGLGR